MSALLVRYVEPLKAHLRRKWGLEAEAAEEILQAFIADKVLERGLVQRADRTRGKFRTFLLTSLDRYVISDYRKRGRRTTQHFDDETQVSQQTEHDMFGLDWARAVIREAVSRMRAECERKGRPDIWEVFNLQVPSRPRKAIC